MTIEEGVELKQIIQNFLSEESGNRITRWNATAFGQTISTYIDKIVAIDAEKNKEKEVDI